MEEELVNLKTKYKDGIFKLESEEEYEEALAKIVNGIDMLAILSKRSEELLEEYSEIVQMYNGMESNRTNENSDLLLDHLINVGIVELMVFELKKHQMLLQFLVRGLYQNTCRKNFLRKINYFWVLLFFFPF